MKCNQKDKNLDDGYTNFLVMIIELLTFLFLPDYFRIHYAWFEIERTIITFNESSYS